MKQLPLDETQKFSIASLRDGCISFGNSLSSLGNRVLVDICRRLPGVRLTLSTPALDICLHNALNTRYPRVAV